MSGPLERSVPRRCRGQIATAQWAGVDPHGNGTALGEAMAYVGLGNRAWAGPGSERSGPGGAFGREVPPPHSVEQGSSPQEVGWRASGVVRVYVCHMWLR